MVHGHWSRFTTVLTQYDLYESSLEVYCVGIIKIFLMSLQKALQELRVCSYRGRKRTVLVLLAIVECR
jgi:hypothetical protein